MWSELNVLSSCIRWSCRGDSGRGEREAEPKAAEKSSVDLALRGLRLRPAVPSNLLAPTFFRGDPALRLTLKLFGLENKALKAAGLDASLCMRE